METKRLLLYVLLAAALTSAIVLFTYQLTRPALPAGTQALAYQFSVAEYPGIDVGTDIFRLGAVSPRSSSFRLLSITDSLTTAAPDASGSAKHVRIVAVGDGHEWLHIEPSDVLVPAVVNVTLSVPDGAEYGIYRGRLLVIPVPLDTNSG